MALSFFLFEVKVAAMLSTISPGRLLHSRNRGDEGCQNVVVSAEIRACHKVKRALIGSFVSISGYHTYHSYYRPLYRKKKRFGCKSEENHTYLNNLK
ncbi:uncharacterized [Tachysurus ichikawai]